MTQEKIDTRGDWHGILYPSAQGPTPIVDAIYGRLMSTLTTDAASALMYDLLWKFTRGDWHGVSDAANDLRVLEATPR